MSDPQTGATRPIRVVLVDDHPALRHGTQVLLEQAGGIEVVGATEQGAAALPLVESLRPDVLLLDVHLPDVSGVEVARRVRERFPEVAVLVLTGYEEIGYLRALREIGVRGFVGKTRRVSRSSTRCGRSRTAGPCWCPKGCGRPCKPASRR